MCLFFLELINFGHIFELLLQRIENLIFLGAKSPFRYAPLWLSQGKHIYHVYELCFVTRRKTWCPELKCCILVVPSRKYKQRMYKMHYVTP
jgi:hypothetical protein